MARKCTICSHKDRNKIDSALAVNGASLRSISERYRVSKSALKRHLDNRHVADKIIKAQHIHEVIEADGVLSEMGRVKQETWIIHTEARARTRKDKDGNEQPIPDNELALKALARLERQIEIESKILGVNPEPTQQTVNVNLNIPEEVKKLVGILPAVKL